jgi:hypothetical protein
VADVNIVVMVRVMKRTAAAIACVRSQVGTLAASLRVLRRDAAGLLEIELDVPAFGAASRAGHTVELFGDTRLGKGGETMMLIAVGVASFVTLLVQAVLAFQKYHFNNGLVLGTTLAAVDWYEDTARRKGLPQSRVALSLIATGATALTLIVQQSTHALAW